MNKTPKEKSVQILIRAKPKEKEKIKSIAMKCNLPVSEYMLQRALGYEPRVLHPDAFYVSTKNFVSFAMQMIYYYPQPKALCLN